MIAEQGIDRDGWRLRPDGVGPLSSFAFPAYRRRRGGAFPPEGEERAGR
jgi:hypothetical protein